MSLAHTKLQQPTPEAEKQRNAYNATFSALGLDWFWDTDTHRSLLAKAQEREPVRVYIETHQPHLLKAYDADFLVNAIHTTQQSRLQGIGF
jgi:hypothetical protein